MEISDHYCCSYTIHNPITNEIIVDTETVYDEAVSLIAYWLDDYLYEPKIKDEALMLAWNEYAAKIDFNDIDFDDFDQFLTEYDNPDWIVLKVTSNPFPDVCNDTWLVVHKDCQITEHDGL
jgi:hypothetical protein